MHLLTIKCTYKFCIFNISEIHTFLFALIINVGFFVVKKES